MPAHEILIAALAASVALAPLLPRRTRPPTAPVTTGVREGRYSARAWAAANPILRASAVGALALAAIPGGALPAPADSDAEGPGVTAVMLVLDASGSMLDPGADGRRKLDRARAALDAAPAARAADRLGLVVFGATADERAPLLRDPARARAALAQAEPSAEDEATALGPALALAVNRLREVDADRRRAVIATDGESNAGALDALTAARLARALGVEVDVLAPDADPAALAPLERIAAEGGGAFSAQDPPASPPVPATDVPRPGRWLAVAAGLLGLELACVAAGRSALA